MPEKKNPDYTESAENLCNPPEIGLKLAELHAVQSLEKEHVATLEKNETYKLLKATERRETELTAQIKEMIDAQGSFQDMGLGLYAVKYRRISKVYDAEIFAEVFPKYVPVVLSTVNVSALEGLIKGGLIKEEELRNSGVLKDDIKYAFVIK